MRRKDAFRQGKVATFEVNLVISFLSLSRAADVPVKYNVSIIQLNEIHVFLENNIPKITKGNSYLEMIALKYNIEIKDIKITEVPRQ